MTINKLIISFCIFLFSCSSCDESTGVRLLEHDYNLVIAIIAPDSVRNYKQEIFFGKILDRKYEDFDKIPKGEDIELNRALLAIRDKYRGEIVGSDGATNNIENKNGVKISFYSVGNGIYRDTINALKVTPLDEYKLEVQDHLKVYTATTIIPGDLQFTNVSNGETVDVPVIRLYQCCPDYKGLFAALTNPSLLAELYRLDVTWDLIPPESARFYHSSDEFKYGFGNPLVLDSNRLSMHTQGTSMRVQSIDANYTNFYSTEPPSSSGMSDSLFHWMITQNEMSIKLRSNIEGSDNVAGVFGSYNMTKTISFYMRAKFPTSQINKTPNDRSKLK